MILGFEYLGEGSYFISRIEYIAKKSGVKTEILREGNFIYLRFEEKGDFLDNLEKFLYNSIFLKRVFVTDRFEGAKVLKLPFNVGFCPECFAQMIDPGSRRYYYPFTMCNSCGHHLSFLRAYPFKRERTLLDFLRPCEKCLEEYENSHEREALELIGCGECAVWIKLSDKKEKRVLYASKGKEFEEIFSIAAAALERGESVLVKTFRGYRRFFKEYKENSYALVKSASAPFLMLETEKRALFAIERPELYLTRDDGKVMPACAVYDSWSALLMSKISEDVIYFDHDTKEFDLKIDHELPLNFYRPIRLFLDKRRVLIKEGSESLFPKRVSSSKSLIYGDFIQHEGIIDKIDRFEEIKTEELLVFRKEPVEHGNISYIDIGASFIRNTARFYGLNEAIGLFFGSKLSLYHYKNGSSREIFEFSPPKFRGEKKVAVRFRERFPERYGDFERESDYILKAARLMGFDGGREEFDLLSHNFGGKGGISIDCRLNDKGFDWESFYSSVMSFVLAEAKQELLAYSIFESLGEFLGVQIGTLCKKRGVGEVVIAGGWIANAPFLSRFGRHVREFRYPRNYPIESIVEV